MVIARSYNTPKVALSRVENFGCWRCLGLGDCSKTEPYGKHGQVYRTVPCTECAATGRTPIPFSEVWSK